MTGRSAMDVWFELNSHVVDYWADVNVGSGLRAHEFYAEDGLFQVGDTRHAGRETIREFYGRRAARGPRVSRHLLSNVRVEQTGDREATVRGHVALFAADGTPVFEAKPPTMIADFEAVCVLDDDRKWRFKTHILTPLFRGEGRLKTS